jgi:hypothetical protein
MMQSMNDSACGINRQEMIEAMCGVIDVLDQAYREQQPLHEVERGLWGRMLQLGWRLLSAFFALYGDGDKGEVLTLGDGRQARRLQEPQTRAYQSPFGAFELTRVVYGSREGQKIAAIPFDEALQLPESKFSYLLEDWDQALEVEMPFAQVSATLERILGFKQSVHSLQRSQRAAAQEVEAFWQAQPLPPPGEEGALVVCTADGKGVPMRGTTAQTCPGAGSPDKGMRPGTKKMALLGAVYTIDPFPRTPQEVLEALFRDPRPSPEAPAPRPKPCFKRVRACLQRDAHDTTEPQTRTIFSWMAHELAQRNPGEEKPVIVLMDGQDSLWNAAAEHLPGTEITEILDLLHATSYLWEAAHLLHPKASPEAARFVRAQTQRMLDGHIATVIRALRRQAASHHFKGKRLEDLQRICGYFANNAHRMAYDQYLAHGFPIASGVIEGACRCVVKDRMERSGMRWVIDGAQAMLGLRSIHMSALWDEFRQFRIHRECQRLYPFSAANDDDFSLPIAA